MDNITHSLVGVMAAEATLSFGKSRGSRRAQTLAFTTSIVANNFPDLDFVYSWITEGKLGYLLHHRGHTHTLVAALGLALFIYALVLGVCRLRHWTLDKNERRKILALALAGGALHILCDFFNSYGVHPYWPFWNGWFYGDSVFILEPWLWLPAAGLIAFGPYGQIARAIGFLLFFGAVSIVYFSRMVPPPGTLLVFGTAVLLLAILRRKHSPRAHVTLALTVFSAIVCTFFVVSARTRSQVGHYMAQAFPEESVLDVVLSPMPSNPFCWNLIVSSRLPTQAETVRKAVWAPFPHVLDAQTCPVFRQLASTAMQGRVVASLASSSVKWLGEHQEPEKTFRDLASEDCRVDAFLKFARVPFTERKSATEIIVGDHRFDWDGSVGFAELQLSTDAVNCPKFVPSWIPPKK